MKILEMNNQELFKLRNSKSEYFKKLGKQYAESLNKILKKEAIEILKSEGSDDPEMDERFTEIIGDYFMVDFLNEFNKHIYVSTEDLEL